MAYSFDEHTTANGRTYAYTFDAVTHDTSNIKVTVGGKHLYDGVSKYDTTNRVPSDSGGASVQGVEYTLTGDSTGGTITINSDVNITDYVASGVPTLSASQILRISRQTNRTTAEISFSSDSVLTDTDLNKSNNQARFLALESIDRTNEGIAIDENDSSRYNLQVDSNDKKIFGVATPTVDNEAANKGYVDGNANIATVAGQISPTNNIASVAGQITPTNNISTVAGKVGDIEKVAHLEDGTTATSAVSKVASRESEIEKLGTDAMTDTSTGYLTKLGVDSMSNATTGNLKKVGDKATEVESVAGKVTEIDTIVNKYDGTDASSGTNKNLVQIDVVADAVANINTVATNIGNVNNFANTYLGAVDGGTDHSNAPTSNRTEGDLYYNTNSSKKGLFVYNGSAWESLETEISGNIVTSTTGENLTLTTPSDSNNVVINSTTGTSGNTIVLPKVRASQNNYVLAMSDTSTGETTWQITATAPTITSITSGQLNSYYDADGSTVSNDKGGTLVIAGSDFGAIIDDISAVRICASDGTSQISATTVGSLSDTSITATWNGTEGAGTPPAYATFSGTYYVEVVKSGMTSNRFNSTKSFSADPTISSVTGTGGEGDGITVTSSNLGSYGGAVAGGGQDSKTKVLLNFDRWGGTDIEDSSNVGGDGHKVTANSDAIIKASPFGDGKSAVYFSQGTLGSGTHDHLSLDHHADFEFGTGLFTIDFWVQTNGSAGGVFQLKSGTNQTVDINVLSIVESGGVLKLYAGGTANQEGVAWQAGVWDHIVIAKSSATSLKYYANGKLIKEYGESIIASDYDFSCISGRTFWIGTYYSTQYGHKGYIDEFRVSKGVDRTASGGDLEVIGDSYTVPTARYTGDGTGTGGGNDSYTKLLIHSDQTYDSSGSNHAVIAKGNSHMTTTNGRANWNNSSWSFDGTDDYLLTPQSSNFDFGTDDFCIEFWWRGDFGGNDIFWSFGTSGDAGSWRMYQEADNKIRVTMGSDGTRQFDTDSSTVWQGDSNWHHFAMTKTGTTLKLYIDGVEETTINGSFTSTPSSSVNLESLDLAIGCDTNGAYDLAGNIVDFRIVKGTTVYTGAFSAPTGSLTTTGGTYPDSTNRTDPTATQTVLLINGDGAKFVDSATSGTTHDITATGSYHSQGHGVIATALSLPTSRKSTGSSGIYFDGTGDYLVTGTSLPALSSTSGALTIDFWFWVASDTPTSAYIYDWRGSLDTTNASYLLVGDTHYYFKPVQGDQVTLISRSGLNNKWNHFCYKREGGGAWACYINGTSEANGTGDSAGCTHSMYLGGRFSNENHLKGYIDSFRVIYSDETASGGSLYHASANTITVPTKIYGAYFPQNPSVGTITITGATADSTDVAFTEISSSLPNGLTLTDGGTSGATDPNGASVSAMTAHITGTLTDSVTSDTVTNNIRIQAKANADDKRITEVNESSGVGAVSITKKAGGKPVLFNARRYMGNSVGLREINGLGFQPDLVWIKNREDTNWNQLNDSVRGPKKVIFSNATHIEDTGGQYLSEFLPDGFRLGQSGTGNSNVEDGINGNSEGIISWAWKAGGPIGSGSAPSDEGKFKLNGESTERTATTYTVTGSGYAHGKSSGAGDHTTYEASYNVDSGFAIIKTTSKGDGTAGNSFPTFIGDPDVIIAKQLDSTSSWFVYHSSSGITSNYRDTLYLDTGASQDTNVSPSAWGTESTIGANSGRTWDLGSNNSINNNGANNRYVYYLWKSVSGVSKFGTYTGSGGAYNSSTGKGGVTDVGFKPRWIMLKSIDASHPWVIFDSFREETDIKNNYIRANEPDSGADGADFAWEFKSTGFEGTSGNTGTWTNETDKTYIYMAFA